MARNKLSNKKTRQIALKYGLKIAHIYIRGNTKHQFIITLQDGNQLILQQGILYDIDRSLPIVLEPFSGLNTCKIWWYSKLISYRLRKRWRKRHGVS